MSLGQASTIGRTQGVSLPEAQIDGFGRVRTSGTGQRLDVEFIYDKQPDFFDEITNNGTVTHNGNSRDLTLALLDADAGSFATMRSHPVPYTPGNPIEFTAFHNPTLTNASWNSIDGSIMEYDVAATAVAGGHVIDAGYVSSSAKNRATSGDSLLGKTVLWNRLGSETGIITIAAIRSGGNDADVKALVKTKEIR